MDCNRRPDRARRSVGRTTFFSIVAEREGSQFVSKDSKDRRDEKTAEIDPAWNPPFSRAIDVGWRRGGVSQRGGVNRAGQGARESGEGRKRNGLVDHVEMGGITEGGGQSGGNLRVPSFWTQGQVFRQHPIAVQMSRGQR